MLIKELVTTCADQHVAGAAVLSLGGDFFSRVEAVAGEHGLSAGEYAAAAVRSFRQHAHEDDWIDLARATKGRDIPILCGMRHIMEKALRAEPFGTFETGPMLTFEGREVGLCCGLA